MADYFTSDLGAVTAYAYAKAHGYTGTLEEFGQLLANAGKNLQQAKDAQEAAADSADAAAVSAAAAGDSAGAAADSASAAADALLGANREATAAGDSAAAARQSELNTAKLAEAAGNSETAAGESAANALESRNAAAESERNADKRATDAENAAQAALSSGGVYYGVEFSGSTAAGVRTGAAADFVFTPGTDTTAGENSFDAVYPWEGMRRCCCTLNADGTIKVNAYSGQPGYAEDGTNGEVLVEIPLFYIAGKVDVDPRISNMKLPGYRVPKKFLNADGSVKQRCYVRAFPGSIGEDGKLHSIAGVMLSMEKDIRQNLAAARLWGEGYSIGTSADAEVLMYLMVVAYGTRDLQAKIVGVSSLYKADIPITAATTDEAAVICAKNAALEVGNIITVNTGGGIAWGADRRMITTIQDIEGDDANKKYILTGAAFSADTDKKVVRVLNATGTANGVLSSCGSPVSNTDGRHSFTFYGVENPLYGNQWRMEADWKVVDGAPYVCNDTNYQWTSLEGYTKLDVTFPTAEGYVKSLAADERYPHLPLPTEVGASSTTYTGDYFWINREGTRIARRGGSSNGGRGAGPFDLALSGTAGSAGWTLGADLSLPG